MNGRCTTLREASWVAETEQCETPALVTDGALSGHEETFWILSHRWIGGLWRWNLIFPALNALDQVSLEDTVGDVRILWAEGCRDGGRTTVRRGQASRSGVGIGHIPPSRSVMVVTGEASLM